MSIIYLCFPKAKWKAQWTLQLSLNQWERKQALDFWWLCSLRVPPESVAPSKLIFPCTSKLLCVLSKHLCDLTHKRPISLPSRTRGRTQSCLLTALTGDQACPCLWVLDWDSLLSTRCTMNAHFAPLSSIGCLWLLVHQSWKENARQGHVGLNPRMAFPEVGGGPRWKWDCLVSESQDLVPCPIQGEMDEWVEGRKEGRKSERRPFKIVFFQKIISNCFVSFYHPLCKSLFLSFW